MVEALGSRGSHHASCYSTSSSMDFMSLFLPLDGKYLWIFLLKTIANLNLRWEQESDERLAALNTLKFSVWFSRGAGLVLTVDTMLILLPMCRTLLRVIRPKVPWLHLDESVWFHRQVAYSMLVYVIIHVTSHYVKYVLVKFLFCEISNYRIVSSTSRGHRFGKRQPYKSTTPRLEV
jgi:hypothetical protein